MKIRKAAIIFLVPALLLNLLPSCRQPAVPETKTPPVSSLAPDTNASQMVPGEYDTLYSQLQAKLTTLEKLVNKNWDGKRYDVDYAAELLAANGNLGPNLLREQTMSGVITYLDGLQRIGVKGVKVSMCYPLMTAEFPRSQEYVAFYQKVVAEVHSRNMVFLAACGPIFANTPFSDVPIDYTGLTVVRYQQGLRQQVETIINQVKPDYITIANEPSTMEMLTGMKVPIADFTAIVNYVLSGLDRKGIKIGAGAGTWNDLDYFKSLAQNTTLDYIDIHHYPINNDFFERAIAAADVASTAGKKVVVGESWLYKVADSELSRTGAMATQAEMFARDSFSFWQPLDERHISLMVKFANWKHLEFISFYWSKFFFSYIDYDKTTKDLPYPELTQACNQEAVKNIMLGKLSGTGMRYKELIGEK